jgi:uncharacterized repeat protein (TIGR01451 family)
MKKLVLLALTLITTSVFAQNYVRIPDANFAKYLREVVPYAMNGDQLDILSTDVKSLKSIDAEARMIKNLEGVQYFIGLDTLDVGNSDQIPYEARNECSTIPNLPPNLKVLICGNLSLLSLPDLPNQLTLLKCYGNSLKNLPMLPNSLLKLECHQNQLTSLPVLPNSLSYLNCYSNYITGKLDISTTKLDTLFAGSNKINKISELPSMIKVVSLDINELTDLPILTENISLLWLSNNSISQLPELPKNLIELGLHENKLTSLPDLPESILNLSISNNQISKIDKLPSQLSNFTCSQNRLKSLPTLPQNLSYIDCSNNQIEDFPEIKNTFVAMINCNNNLITKFPPLNYNLSRLDCSYNKLTELPELTNYPIQIINCSFNELTSIPTLPLELKKLDCSNNKIKCLPLLPNSLTNESTPIFTYTYLWWIAGWTSFQENFDSPALNFKNNQITCLPNYVSALDSLTLKMPLCEEQDINNQAGCELGKRGLLGYTFFNDTTISNIPVILLDENKNQLGITYTALNGVYQFVKDSANYHVQIDTTNIPFKVISPYGNDTLVSITKNNPFADSVNFNLSCKDGFDVGIRSVATTGIVFPGQPHTLHVSGGDMSNWFGKDCAKGISGQLQLTVTGPVKYSGPVGKKTPVINGNIYTYEIADFGSINFNEDFGLAFVTDTTAKADDQICVVAQITPTNGDYNLSNNTYDFCYSVINSHDPNLKEVYPANFRPGYDGYFTYTIHFQNTGNAPAFNIRLLDTLDTAFDLTTFEVMNYSHANRVSLNGNIMNVYFKNIQLQDSTTNEKESHGFIQYRIKPKKAVSESDQIKNTAHIYFDFNEAVVTNTTVSTATKSLGLDKKNESILRVYPNPAETSITLARATSSNSKIMIQITNVNGQEVYATTIENTSNQVLDISTYTPGMYFINIISETSNEVIKVIKK